MMGLLYDIPRKGHFKGAFVEHGGRETQCEGFLSHIIAAIAVQLSGTYFLLRKTSFIRTMKHDGVVYTGSCHVKFIPTIRRSKCRSSSFWSIINGGILSMTSLIHILQQES